WIRQAVPFIPKDSPTDQYNLANAWYSIGVQYGTPSALKQATEILTAMTQRPNPDASAYLLLGATREKLDDRPGAIDAYRHALTLKPDQPVTQNNLAYQLYLSGDQLEEARALTEKAVASSPRESTYWHTLAPIP